MNKQELIDAVAAQTGASKASTNEVIDEVFGAITRAVVAGDTVQLIGFGSFGAGARAARTGRNPKTGEPLEIAAAKTVKFTAGKGRCCKNRSLQGVTFTRNGRGAASVNLGRNCVDSRYLAGRCARTNAKVGSLKGSIESGTGRSTTQG